MLLHFVVFAHRSTTTPRSFASRRGKYFLCKLPWNLAARNFGAGKAVGRKLTGRKPETRTKHALKFQLVQACVLLSTEGSITHKKVSCVAFHFDIFPQRRSLDHVAMGCPALQCFRSGKSAHNETCDFYVRMALIHECCSVRCFCRDSGNIAR